ncbi:MAG: hypothetical protein ACYC7A_04195 [Thermoanaerobaculia bacterium]
MANELTSNSVPVAKRARRGDPVLDAGWYFAGFLAFAVFAFWPTYFGKLPAKIGLFTHLHAIGMMTWFALLIAQPMLVGRGLMKWHRALGRLSYAVVPFILCASLLLAHARTRALDEATFARFGKFVYLPIFTVIVFAVIYVLAIVYRHTMALHARFMIGTAFTMIDPAIARIIGLRLGTPDDPLYTDPLFDQLVGFGVTDLILVALIVLERNRKQGRAAFPIVLALFATGHILWFTLGQSQAWFAVARWFRELPLT